VGEASFDPKRIGVMRLPEHEIKEAILRPDPEIRDRATSYFAKSFSSDPGIMPLVIEAVETHGKRDAYRLIGLARDLPQSEATIAWVVRELNDPQTDQYENYAYNLSMVLAEADPALLLPIESAVTEARHFPPTCVRHSPSGSAWRPGTRRPAGRGWRSSAKKPRTTATPPTLTWATPDASSRRWPAKAATAKGGFVTSCPSRCRTTTPP
jgi:hypothetical protein